MNTPKSTKTAMAVSKNYFKSLRLRVTEIVESICGFRNDEWIEFVMSMITDYINGESDAFFISGRACVECEVICLTLKAEIDKAMERSRRARERAALRRQEKAPGREDHSQSVDEAVVVIAPESDKTQRESGDTEEKSAYGPGSSYGAGGVSDDDLSDKSPEI